WIDELQSRGPGGSAPSDLRAAFMSLMGSPTVASKRWIWEQYDHMIFLGTVVGPGGDAAVIRLPDQEVAVALSVDGPGRFCYLDPYEGARLAVAESARNVACTGARPLAVTNCLNFGNPEKPEVMWQFAEAVRGIGDACRALATPVTGGNVSFYNETGGRSIYPTPVIGMLGAIESAERAVGSAFRNEGDAIVLLGTTREDFGGSEFAKVINDTVAGRPPQLNMEDEIALQRFLVDSSSRFVSAHDLSEGGLAVALAESAINGNLGFSITEPMDHVALFSESPSRVIVSVAQEGAKQVVADARSAGVDAKVIGRIGGRSLNFGSFGVGLEEAGRVYEETLPKLLSHRVG
ncbi:MAG TPA: AIR synthase related protein, partial [Actinomycetota bacterium]|nr:AIR synthase related protein [Actinomycetota bacterium]